MICTPISAQIAISSCSRCSHRIVHLQFTCVFTPSYHSEPYVYFRDGASASAHRQQSMPVTLIMTLLPPFRSPPLAIPFRESPNFSACGGAPTTGIFRWRRAILGPR